MIYSRPRRDWIIVSSFLVAFLLTAIPVPEWAAYWRPEWVAMVLFYWCMALPQRVGIGTAWGLGLILDVLKGSLLGQHALGFSVTSFIILKTHQRIRVFPLFQQALIIFFLVVLHELLVLWVQGIIGKPPDSWKYWLPAVTTMLLWPWLFILLRDVRRRFQVN